MNTFEECLAMEEYRAQSRERARKRRRNDRAKTREENKQNKTRARMYFFLLAILAALAAVLATLPTEETEQPAPTEAPVQSEIQPDTAPEEELSENELIEAALLARAHTIEDVLITHYCSERYPHICGTGDGVTASGRWLQPYVSCAVDPDVIPLGSTVMVDYGDGELHYYVADDVGAWVNGAHIDLAVTTHDEALSLGTKYATIYWAEEG